MKFHFKRRGIGVGGLSAARRNHLLDLASVFFRYLWMVYLWMANPKYQTGLVQYLPGATHKLHTLSLIYVEVIAGHPREFRYILKACKSEKHCVNIV